MLLKAPAVRAQPDPPFRSVTRQKVRDLGSQSITAWGANPLSYRLPNTGYLSRIFVPMRGTISTGAGTPAGSFNGYPYQPYGSVNNFTVANNNNNSIVSVSGWGLALLNLFQERSRQAEGESIAPWNTTNRAQTFAAPIGAPGGATGTVAASTAYNVNAGWKIGISTDDVAMFGLQPLQNNALQSSLIITPAGASAAQGNITGVIPTTPALAIRPSAEFFQAPPWSGSQPDLRFTHGIFEDYQAIQAVGQETVYRPLPGPVYLRIVVVVENNGAPVPYGSITQVAFRHSQSENPYLETYDQHLERTRCLYGFTLPDGVIVYDFASGYGIPGIVEPRDFVDTAQLTDVQIGITLASSLTLAGTSQLRVIREFLSNTSPQ